MAHTANISTSYALSNYERILGDVIAKAEAEMNKPKGGAAQFKQRLLNSIRSSNFSGEHQIRKPSEGRQMTIAELCESYKNESIAQAIDPKAVEKILFGPDGLIRKSGGGRAPHLMEDIEVGFIYDPVEGTSIGPVITSGRNRTLAIQVMLHAAGMSEAAIMNVSIRVSVIQVLDAQELQRRIISANTGSRDFSRAEVRERMGAASGLQMINRKTIEDSIILAKNEKSFKAALGSWLKDASLELGLNTFTPAQYADAGNSLWTRLAKSNRPEGSTFYTYVKADTSRFVALAKAAEQALPAAATMAASSKAAGPISTKLVNAMLPTVAQACGLKA
jgi:tryptophan 2,3-dioxygenase